MGFRLSRAVSFNLRECLCICLYFTLCMSLSASVSGSAFVCLSLPLSPSLFLSLSLSLSLPSCDFSVGFGIYRCFCPVSFLRVPLRRHLKTSGSYLVFVWVDIEVPSSKLRGVSVGRFESTGDKTTEFDRSIKGLATQTSEQVRRPLRPGKKNTCEVLGGMPDTQKMF